MVCCSGLVSGYVGLGTRLNCPHVGRDRGVRRLVGVAMTDQISLREFIETKISALEAKFDEYARSTAKALELKAVSSDAALAKVISILSLLVATATMVLIVILKH